MSRTPQGVRGLKYSILSCQFNCTNASHPARGAWIEIPPIRSGSWRNGSHPARGAWIEMWRAPRNGQDCDQSHPARGAWIEIYRTAALRLGRRRRTPQGVRGLKSSVAVTIHSPNWSHPARGAWIEIKRLTVTRDIPPSHPARGAWIEMIYSCASDKP